jgi:hypothetical protein
VDFPYKSKLILDRYCVEFGEDLTGSQAVEYATWICHKKRDKRRNKSFLDIKSIGAMLRLLWRRVSEDAAILRNACFR